MKQAGFFALLYSCVLALLACSSKHEVAGGGIWDETENGVAVLVSDSAGKPIASARVRLLPLSAWSANVLAGQSPVQDSAVTGRDGRALLHTTEWPATLEVETSAGMHQQLLRGPDSALHVVPKAPAQLTGTLVADTGSLPQWVRLAGTSLRTPLDSTGKFSFARVPAGQQGVVAERGTYLSLVTTRVVSSRDSMRMGALALHSDADVLLEDFEDFHGVNRYDAITGSGWWYTAYDTLSRVYPDAPADGIVTGSEAWQGGHSLHVRLAVDTNAPGKYALVGMDIEDGVASKDLTHAFHDLRHLDSITFMARGSGHMYMQVFSGIKVIDGFAQPISAKFTLDSVWTRVAMYPQDFKGVDSQGDTLTWDQVAPYIVGFALNTGEPTELWLDDVRFHGISEHQLFQSLSK